MKNWNWLVLVLAAGFLANPYPPLYGGDGGNPEILLLANEGFLIQAGNEAVLIDGFLKKSYYNYDPLPAELYEKLTQAAAPFDRVRLALASHVHEDHFQPEAAIAFLKASPEAFFYSGSEVIEAFQKAAGENADSLKSRVVSVDPENGNNKLKIGGIAVEILKIRHVSPRFYHIQNLVHVITIGHKTVVHVGDAEPLAEHFEKLGLENRNIDAVILPNWFFANDAGKAVIDRFFKGAKIFASHFRAQDFSVMNGHLERNFPDVICLEKPLDGQLL